MGPNKKKTAVPVDDWDTGIPVDTWDTGVAITEDEWKQIDNSGPNVDLIDTSKDAPTLIRAEVGALTKREDRLTALRKHYPDAQYDPEDPENNFIYTDEGGSVRRYNNPNWLPFSPGDWASIAPEGGEMIGSGIGAVGGTIGGGALGSTIPILGTGAGAVGGAITGAGLGAAAGRDLTQRGLNAIFGNEDTRTTGEWATDTLQTGALGAAGQGGGMIIGKGANIAWNAGKKAMIGGGIVDDAATVARRLDDFRATGVEPTPGMISGSERQATIEHALKTTKPGQHIEARIKDAFGAQGNEWDRVVGSMTGGNQPMSKAEIGESLRAQAEAAKKAGFARSEQLYDDVAKKVTSPASANHTADFVKRLADQRANMGEFDVLNRGAQTDQAIKQAAAVVTDAQNGMSFEKLKQARSQIGKMAAGENDPVLKGHYDSLYASLTEDMKETALASGPDAKQAWQKANNQFKRLVDSEKGFGKGSVSDAILNKDTDRLHDFIFNNRKSGGNQIAAARRNFIRNGSKEEWDNLSGSFINRLGTKTTEDGVVFDPATFLREWQDKNFSKEAKNAVFSGTKNQKHMEDLDRVARNSDNLKRYNKHDNHSNTAKHQTALGTLNPLSAKNIYATALGTFIASGNPLAAAAVIGSRATMGTLNGGYRRYQAKLITSPETTEWLANVPSATMKNGGLKSHVAKLKAIGSASKDNALAQAISEFLNDLGYTDE